VNLLILLLVLAMAAYVLLGRWERRQRAGLGLPVGHIVAADDSAVASPALRSERLGLVGRPDQLLRSGGQLIPVEQKPRSRHVQASHVMQVAAQCLLVHEVYGVRPAYGVLVLAGGVQERIPFTPAIERRLRQTMTRMRTLLEDDVEPGPRWNAPKCRACGFVETCWNSDAQGVTPDFQ
jgi:CRISPR-associated protein Cas4